MDSALKKGKRAASDTINWLRQHPTVVLLIIFLFHAVNNVIFVSLDRAPFVGNDGFYFELSWYQLSPIREGDIAGFIYSLRLPGYSDHPPLQTLISIPFYLAFGYSPDVAVLSALPAALLLIFSVYHIGKELKDTDAGLLAAALTALFPGIFAFSRSFQPEFTITATVALSLAILLKTKHFSHKHYTFAFGMSIALGLLANWSFIAFVIGPAIFYLYLSYREVIHASKSPRTELLCRGKWLVFSVLLGLFIALLWYVPNLGEVTYTLKAGRSSNIGREGILSRWMIPYYLKGLYTAQMGIPFIIAASVLLVCLLIARLERKTVAFLFLWFIIPYSIYTFVVVSQKLWRYCTPYLPAFTILLAIGSLTLRPKLKHAMVSVLLVVGLIQFFALSYFTEPIHPVDRWERGAGSFDTKDWQLPEIISTLNSLLANISEPQVLSLDHYVYYSWALKYPQFMGMLIPFNVSLVLYPCEPELNCDEAYLSNLRQELIKADVVIADKDPLSVGGNSLSVGVWNSTRTSFAPVKTITLPDNRPVIFYVRKGRGMIDDGENQTGE